MYDSYVLLCPHILTVSYQAVHLCVVLVNRCICNPHVTDKMTVMLEPQRIPYLLFDALDQSTSLIFDYAANPAHQTEYADNGVIKVGVYCSAIRIVMGTCQDVMLFAKNQRHNIICTLLYSKTPAHAAAMIEGVQSSHSRLGHKDNSDNESEEKPSSARRHKKRKKKTSTKAPPTCKNPLNVSANSRDGKSGWLV